MQVIINNILDTLKLHNSTLNRVNNTITLMLIGMAIQTISIIILGAIIL